MRTLPVLALLFAATPQIVAQVNFASLNSPKATSFADVADYRVAFEPTRAKPGEVVSLRLTVAPRPGYWTYPTDVPADQDGKNVIRVPQPGTVIFVGDVKDPDGAKVKAGSTDLHYTIPATWVLKGIVSPLATPGKKQITLTGTRLQVCNDSNCYFTDKFNPPSAELEILPGPAVPVPSEFKPLVEKAIGPAPAPAPAAGGPPAPPPPATAATPPAEPTHAGLVRKDPIPPGQYKANLDDVLSRLVAGTAKLPSNSLWTFLLTAAVWGWVSLATPCVFPMIPITVSLFLKQSHQSAAQAVKLSLVYCLTIILVLGLSAVALLSVFRKLSVDPYMNIFLGGLFVVFALSLFGMYDITLPGFLLRFTEKRRGAGGYVGTVFGALAFSIVSFTCVAPFLGGFAGMAASGQFADWELVAGGLTFAAAFASPFFVLALFPSLLKKLPRSGGWLDTVKAVMGFLELAAALKFFRTAELRLLPRPEYFTYDLVLAGWVAITAACGLYLLGVFRLPHDDEEKSRVGVTRLLFALGFLWLGVYLVPATFKTGDGQGQRPAGEVYNWVDAFLLPEPSATGPGELPWATDLKGAIEKARSAGGKPGYVFVDFNGVTCTNCKLNEKKVFPRPDVNELMRKYTLVQLYTDTVPADVYRVPPAEEVRDREATSNLAFQQKAFGTQQLPLYAILEPQVDGKVRVVDVYDEGKINDVPRFVEFLKKPLAGK